MKGGAKIIIWLFSLAWGPVLKSFLRLETATNLTTATESVIQTVWSGVCVIFIAPPRIVSRGAPHSFTGWRRVIGWLICISHFPQKSPLISDSVAKNDLQLKASYGSSPPCTTGTFRIGSFLPPSSPLNRQHIRAILEISFFTMKAGVQISVFTMKAGRPAPPLTLPRPPPFAGILLSVILGLPFRELSVSEKECRLIVRDINTQVDSKTIGRLRQCQNIEVEYRS